MVGRRRATLAEARAFAHPLRVRIVRLLHDEPLTNRELALRLDVNPATSLHHVRTLLRAGFVEAMPERRGTRGAREVPYRSTGKSWRLDWADLPVPLSTAIVEAFVAEVGSVPEEQVQVARLALRLTPARQAELSQRIFALLEEFADDEGDESWAAFVALHPRARETSTPSRARG